MLASSRFPEPGDPFPGQMSRSERVVTMNPDVVSSHIHEFLELLSCARALHGADAIQGCEESLSLYVGDLLDRADVANHRWMYENPRLR